MLIEALLIKGIIAASKGKMLAGFLGLSKVYGTKAAIGALIATGAAATVYQSCGRLATAIDSVFDDDEDSEDSIYTVFSEVKSLYATLHGIPDAHTYCGVLERFLSEGGKVGETWREVYHGANELRTALAA